MSTINKSARHNRTEKMLESESNKRLAVRGNIQVNIGLNVSEFSKLPQKKKAFILSLAASITIILIMAIVATNNPEFAKEILDTLEKLLTIIQIFAAAFGLIDKQVK